MATVMAIMSTRLSAAIPWDPEIPEIRSPALTKKGHVSSAPIEIILRKKKKKEQ